MKPTFNARLYLKRIENDSASRRQEYNLVFPNKCAYCNKSLTTTQEKVNYDDLNFERITMIPYCSEHKKTKPISRKQFAKFTALLGLIIGVLAGIFFYSRGILVFRNVDLSIAAGFIIFTITTALLYSLGLPIFLKKFPQGDAYLDASEAVRVSEVLPNSYILQFHNKEFANEFAHLNKDRLFRKSEITEHPDILFNVPEIAETDSVAKPTNKVEQKKTSQGEIHQKEDKSSRATEQKQRQDIHSEQPTHPPSSENMELIVKLRKNLSVKVMYDEAKVDRLIDYERRLNPNASLVVLIQAAIDRWERDNR